MARLPDEFEIRARTVLGSQNQRLLTTLLALRAKARRTGAAADSLSADELNAQNQELFDKAAELLGREKFEAIFGSAPFQKIDLVDANLLESNREQRGARGFASRYREKRAPPAANVGTAAAPVITLKHLAASVAEQSDLSKKQAEAIIGEMVDLVVKHLKKGDRIRIGGFGILQVRKRAARMGRNPRTGEQIKIKASKKVAFRASKHLKESI